MSQAIQNFVNNSDFNTADQINKIIENVNNTVVVAPQGREGVEGFQFTIEDSHVIDLQNEITDHYVEDNSTIQDHIAVKPLKFSLRGFVAEKKFTVTAFDRLRATVNQKLSIVNAYLPEQTSGMTQIFNTAAAAVQTTTNLIDTAVDNGQSLFSFLAEDKYNFTQQQYAYSTLSSISNQGIVVTVQTPWKFLPNMVIESLNVTQGSDSKDVSEFFIVFKQIRTATTQFATFDLSQYQSRGKGQRAEEQNKGKVSGEQEEQSSALYSLFN